MLAAVAEAACVAGGNGPECLGDLVRQRQRPVQQQRVCRRAGQILCKRRPKLLLGLRPDSRHLAKPPLRGRLAQLVERADAERLRDVHRALGAQPEQPPDADEIGGDSLLELLQLVQVAGLDELAEAGLDGGADAANLPDPAGPDELRDRHRGVAQDVRGTSVGAHAVGVGVRKLEQRREGIELRRNLRILWIARTAHLGSVPAVASVVVPFRAASAKRRLELPEAERTDVAHAMLGRVLASAVAVGPTILVTEADASCARALAAEHGVEVVDDPGKGQGEAVAAALAVVDEWPVLVVNADVPAARPRDLLALLGAMPPGGIAITEAEDGTTNALALSQPGLFAPLYGPGSADRFRAHAASQGVDVVTLDVPALADDVDTVAEFEQLRS